MTLKDWLESPDVIQTTKDLMVFCDWCEENEHPMAFWLRIFLTQLKWEFCTIYDWCGPVIWLYVPDGHINARIHLDGEVRIFEDPVQEDDLDGFGMIKGDVICGDDLVYGNLERLKEVAGKINCVCIKPTQAGSMIKIKNLIDWAKENNVEVVMSHRSGETDDPMIADLSVAWKTQYIKTGIVGKFNTPKIKRLKEIEKAIL